MILYFFSSLGWQDWDIERAPVVPDRMPVLVDDDLRFEDGSATPRWAGSGLAGPAVGDRRAAR